MDVCVCVCPVRVGVHLCVRVGDCSLVWSGKLVHVENAAIVPALSCQGAALPCSTGQKASTTVC